MELFMDQALARRLERTEAEAGTSCVETRHRLAPAAGVRWHDFAGTVAIDDGPDSPMTQTFGLGLATPATADALAAIEAFYADRGGAVMHEVSPLAGVETSALLVQRGYRPIEQGTVLVQPLTDAHAREAPGALRVRVATDADRPAWKAACIAGWSSDAEAAPMIAAFAELVGENRGMIHVLAEAATGVISTGSLVIHAGVALLAGASTVPAARGRGAQTLLLAARLAEARRRGCELAMMVATPGSTSQRNAERRGFRVAYTRTKWRLEPAAG